VQVRPSDGLGDRGRRQLVGDRLLCAAIDVGEQALDALADGAVAASRRRASR